MEPTGQSREDNPIGGVEPERWETAIEDLAQLVALGLDRAQDLYDAIGDLLRARPGLAQAIAAGIIGTVVGALIASRLTRPRSLRERMSDQADSTRGAVARRMAILEQAATIAAEAAQRLARSMPSREQFEERIPRVGRGDRAEQGRRRTPARGFGAGDVAGLAPIGLALLKNPLVRQMLWRSAARATRRAFR